jgi:hypothetical protein
MGAAERQSNVTSTGPRLVSRSRGHALVALVHATRERCGDPLANALLARLPDAFLGALDDGPDWVPTEFIVAWHELLFEALHEDEERFAAVTRRAMDLGFGKVRRLLLGIANPHWMLRKGAELWRGEHSTGRMTAYAVEPRHARVTLVEHAFLDSAVMRGTVVASIAYALSLTGAKGVRTHCEGDVGEPLVVTMTWQD